MKQIFKEDGFTAIEMIIFFVILVILAAFFVIQKLDLEASFADDEKKTTVNSIYYNLTDIYHKEHKYYPSEIKEDTLRGIDSSILYDDYGFMINDPESVYRYEGLDCDSKNHCRNFRLTADLEKEDDYEKTSY